MPELDARDYEIRIWYSAEKGDECFVAQVVEWSPRARCDIDKRSAAESREPGGSSQSSQREWSRWESSDIDGQTREGETSGKTSNQALRDGQAKRGARRELGNSSQSSQREQSEMDKRSAAESRGVGMPSQKVGNASDLDLLQKTFDRMK